MKPSTSRPLLVTMDWNSLTAPLDTRSPQIVVSATAFLFGEMSGADIYRAAHDRASDTRNRAPRSSIPLIQRVDWQFDRFQKPSTANQNSLRDTATTIYTYCDKIYTIPGIGCAPRLGTRLYRNRPKRLAGWEHCPKRPWCQPGLTRGVPELAAGGPLCLSCALADSFHTYSK